MFDFLYPPMYRTDFFEDRLHSFVLLFDNSVLKELTDVITPCKDNTKLVGRWAACVLDYKSVPQIILDIPYAYIVFLSVTILLVAIITAFITDQH